MCARYTLTRRQEEILKTFTASLVESFEPNYRLAPTQCELVKTADELTTAQKMHFGLVPYWAADTELNISTLNARSEEVLENKTYAPDAGHPEESNKRLWLDKQLSPADLLRLCDPYPDDKMVAYRVGADVHGAAVKGVVNNRLELDLSLNSF